MTTTFEPPPRFRLLRQLGQGGMGVVYEVFDEQRSARVALKTIREASADVLLRFKREFRALQDLDHRNLVRLGELFSDGEQWFFTMELVDGTDIISFVRGAPGGSTPVDHALLRRCIAQLVEGLDRLHRANKVHRDVKPANVLVTKDERVVLLDFGVVSDLDDADASTATQGMVGTATYMAPEQALCETVAPSADLYSVGVLLYEALTGRPPFEGSTHRVVHSKLTEAPTPPSAIEPDVPPDLEALATELLALDPAARPGTREVIERLRGHEIAATATHATHDRTFVGRGAELDTLACAFEETRLGKARIVIVEGESGVGKSALVRQFVNTRPASPGAVVVLSGRCRERESVPYKAFDGVFDALSRFLSRTPSADAVLPRRVDLLAQAFPVLLAVDAVASAPLHAGERLDDIERRRRLFAATRELFERLAGRFGVVLVLEDLQWTDTDSLALLTEIVRPPDAPAVLVLATQRRSIDAGTRDRIAKAVGEDARTIVVGSLSPEEAKLLAERLSGGVIALSPEDVERLAREAKGHPLFLDELIRYAAAGGTSQGDVRLDDALWARVERLEAIARDLVVLLAVAGGPVAASVLARAAGTDAASALARIESLRSAQFVRGTDLRPNEVFEAYHDRVREAVLAKLSPDDRQRAHQRLAQALEADGSTDAEGLARHWRGAGEPVRAARYAVQAADAAVAMFAFDHAAGLYRLAAELDPPSGERAVALWSLLGDALTNAGRGGDSAQAYLEAAARASPKTALVLKERAASQLMRAGRMEEGMRIVREVLAAVGMALPATPLRALASFVFWRILLRIRGFGFRERHERDVPPDSLLIVDLLWSLSFVLSFVDTVRGGAFQARHALWALRAGEPHRIVRALGNEAPYGVSIGRAGWARTERIIERTRAIAERLDDPRSLAYVAIAAGIASYLAGRYEESLRSCDEGLRFARNGAGAWGEAMRGRHFACNALSMMGDYEELARRLPEYLSDAELHGDAYGSTNLQIGHPHLSLLAHDDLDRARAAITYAGAFVKKETFTLESHYMLTAEVLTDLYCEQPEAAWQKIEERWPALERTFLLRIQSVRYTALYTRARAAIALAARDPARRAALVDVATRGAKGLARDPRAWGMPLALLLRAGIASVRGQSPLAHLDAAARLFPAYAMHVHAAAARWWEGELRGGERGAALRDEAERFLRARGVAQPRRIAAILAPGFDR